MHPYQCILLVSGGAGKHTAHCDAYAECILTRRSVKSITRCVIMVDGDVVDWKSKKQSVVAQLSTEAEYISLAVRLNSLSDEKEK